MLNFKLPPPIPTQALTRTFDDDRSVGSTKSRQSLLAQLFFQNDTSKVAAPNAPIGEVSLSGNYPFCDKDWSFWLVEQHDNAHKLSEHEKCHQGSDADETTRGNATVLDDL